MSLRFFISPLLEGCPKGGVSKCFKTILIIYESAVFLSAFCNIFHFLRIIDKLKNYKMEKRNIGKLIAGVVIIAFVFVAALMFGLPRYNVWQQEMAGKAEMAKAEQNRRILVEEAKAKLEAEKLNAQAEIERAKGMAEAMKLENGTLSETYNQYLFIRTLEKLADKGDLPQIIYVPTNGMVPVMDVSKKSPVKQMQE